MNRFHRSAICILQSVFWRMRQPLAVMAIVMLLLSCSYIVHRWRAVDGLIFSHRDHKQYVAECSACHLDAATGEMTAAGHGACVTCHPAANEEAPADGHCMACHSELPPPQKDPGAWPDYSLAKFKHPAHAKLDCSACHGEVNRMQSLRKIDRLLMEDCLACHYPSLREASSAPCAYCHLGITTEMKPENHARPNWDEGHGVVSYEQPFICERCHQRESFCHECHLRERPRSHTAGFRAKTHGFQAMSNPISCETCHRQDFCIGCHTTTEPQNHTAGFGSRPYRHCMVCHIPLEEGNRCAVCHRGDPHGGVIAKPPPPALVASGQIRLDEPCLPCHPVNLRPITHPYNTLTSLECIQCHRP